MSNGWFKKKDPALLLALYLPLLIRFYQDGADAALQRLIVMVLVFAVAYGWSAIFAKRMGQGPAAEQVYFAMVFSLLLPAPVSWGGAMVVASFGWVFGREVFGGKAILPPALIALAFALFSFPGGGYEEQWILSATPNPWLAASCLPGAAWLLWKGLLPWRVLTGVFVGAAAVALLMTAGEAPPWWHHFMLGAFVPGVLFLAAASENMPRAESARWLYGVLIGALIIVIRLANPDQPDGVVLAILLGGLLAPLVDRALSWRPAHG